MQIKYVVYTAISNNLGDNAQAYAIYKIFRKMDISEEDIVIANRNNILNLCRMNAMHIVPCSMSAVNYYDLIEYICDNGVIDRFVFLPLSIGLLRNSYGSPDAIREAQHISDKMMQPIGCRDYDTQEILSKMGYATYMFGCITNTFPKREENNSYQDIYFYDIPNAFMPYIPEVIKSQAKTLTKHIDLHIPPEQLWNKCLERYRLLRDTARLVVTVNYHVATPCAAMGIPVIMVDNCADGGFKWMNDVRLPALNPHIPYYTREQWHEIDWNPQPINYEDIKACMINVVVRRISDASLIIQCKEKLHDFYKPSRERFLDICNQNIGNVDIMGFDEFLGNSYLKRINKDVFRFYLYGISNHYVDKGSCSLLDYVKRRFPKAVFLGFIDGYKEGSFQGKAIVKPSDMRIDEDTYCLVSAYSANDYVEKLFKAKGYDLTHLWKMPEGVLFYIYHL